MMKGRSLPGYLVGISALLLYALPAVAQSSERYPTNAEVQQAIREFRSRVIPAARHSGQFGLGERDPRLDTFTSAWSKVDPAAASLLGMWDKGTSDMQIYPSYTKGRVCIILSVLIRGRTDGDMSISFTTGTVQSNQLLIGSGLQGAIPSVYYRESFIRQGNYLGRVGIYNGKPNVNVYSSYSYLLISPIKLRSNNQAEKAKIVRQFEAAGCTTSLPGSSQIATNRSPSTPRAYTDRGDARSRNGDKKGAIADYTEAIRLNPGFATAYYNRAIDRVAIGDKQGAIADFRKAAELFRQQGRGSDRQDALNEIAKLGGERSPQDQPILQTFRNARELGMAQLLQSKQERLAAFDLLNRVAKEDYRIPNWTKSEFMKARLTDVAETPGQFLGKRREVSFADYLTLKLKINAQAEAYKQSDKIFEGIRNYAPLMDSDTRFEGRQARDRILSNFNSFQAQLKQRYSQRGFFDVENIKRALTNSQALMYSIEESRVSTAKLIVGTTKAGGKLATAFTQLKIAKDFLESVSPEQLERRGRKTEYLASFIQKLKDLQPEDLLAQSFRGESDKILDLTLEVASDTIKLLDAQDPRLSRSADAIKIYSTAKNLIARHEAVKKPEVARALNDFDKFYLANAQLSAMLEIASSTLSLIAPQSKPVKSFADKADSVRGLLFDALDFTYREEMRRTYENFEAQFRLNKQTVADLQLLTDSFAEEVGQYLLKSRSDVVTRRSDGTIAVSTKGIINPPKP